MNEHRWLICGSKGMLGTDLMHQLEARGEEAIGIDREELDITVPRAVDQFLRENKPTIVINCAAYTKVDAAEEEEHAANILNGSAVEFLARSANTIDALLVQLSTDFVFDGHGTEPYEVNDTPRPLSAYGRSKLLGELAASHATRHAVVRTSWLFGKNGPNFVEAIRGQVNKGTNPLRVVSDQRGRPTYTPHLAAALIRIALRAYESENARGILHYADDGECSWFDFASEIVEMLGAPTEVVPVTTDEFPRPARRPAYSVLSTERYERICGVKPDSWREGLREYLIGQ